MSRCAWALALLLALGSAAAPAPAQTPAVPEAEAEIPDVPVGEARITGVVLFDAAGTADAAPRPAADIDVVLYSLDETGAGLRRTASDADGRFAFEDIAATPGTTYLVGARYRGMPFPGGRVRFAEDEREHRVEIRLAEPTSDPSGVVVAEARILLDWIGGQPTVSEHYRLENPGGRPYYVRDEDRVDSLPALLARLPDGAGELASPLGMLPEGLERRGDEVTYWGPVYDAPQTLSFIYELPGGEDALEVVKSFPSRPREASLWIAQGGPPVAVEGLGEPEAVTVEDRSFDRYVFTPGEPLRFRVERPPVRRDRDAFAIGQVRWILEFDQVTLLVSEAYELEVEGDAHVMAPDDGPLLRIPLPEGAELTGLSPGAARLGVRPDDDGGLALHGPLPPGDSRLELGYRLTVNAPAVDFERRFRERVPLLSVFVGDVGLTAESDRLHRRRPVRSNDRNWMQLEAFELAAGEPVSLRLETLPGQQALSRSAAALLVLVLAGIAAAVMIQPVRRSRRTAPPAQPAEAGEREALLQGIRDLDHDFETGKITAEDHAALRDDLRRRAALLLEAERAAAARTGSAGPDPAGAPAPATARDPARASRCTGCDAPLGAEDRFCSRCGTAVEASRREASA